MLIVFLTVAGASALTILALVFWPAGKNTTVVYLRSTSVPVHHWQARVHYDAWGSPYTTPQIGGIGISATVLYPGGRTSYTGLYGTEWKHKAGPPVSFAEHKPSRPFDAEPINLADRRRAS